MKLKRRDKPAADVDLVAFADVAFLLIIFFILTTTFVKNRGQALEMPSASKDPENVQNEVLTVNVTESRLLLNGREELPDVESLRLRLAQEGLAQLPEAERLVLIESAPDVVCGRYYQVVTAIAESGGILAMLEEESGE